MLSVDAAFDRIGSALRERGYKVDTDERPADKPEDRVVVFISEDMHVRLRWHGKARMRPANVASSHHRHVADERARRLQH